MKSSKLVDRFFKTSIDMRQMRLASLRTKLIIFSLLVALIPLLLVSYINLQATNQAILNNASQVLSAAASQTANNIDTFIDTNLSALRVEAGIPTLARYLEQVATSKLDKQTAINAFAVLMSLSRKDKSNIISYGLLDIQGKNLLDTYTPNQGLNESQQDYFIQPLQTDLAYVSSIQSVPTLPQQFAIYFSSLVRNSQGKILGVLRVCYKNLVIQKLIASHNGLAGKDSFAVLFDEYHIRLAHGTLPELILKSVVPLPPEQIRQLQEKGRLAQKAKDILSTNFPELEAILKSDNNQSLSILHLAEINNQQMGVQIASLQYAPWKVMFAQPKDVFFTFIKEQTQTILLLSIVIIGIVILVAMAIARLLTNPLLSLTNTVSQFADGNLNVFARTRSNDEIGQLAVTFNQMASQLRQSFYELEQANSELEERVEARTDELSVANLEITKLNEKLKTENVQLNAEVDIVRRLQQMILPTEVELENLPHLDVAGFMESAEQVGGDYYDVVQNGDRINITIGDVTGHGLESGVVMLMAQTAVRTLLASEEKDPVRFMNILNQVIHTNTRRMKSNKSMTLVMLEYEGGNILLSGQHEELIIVRRNGKIDSIDTFDLGFPLGIESDISAFISQAKIPFQHGDVAVLFTDGITEAENQDRKLYGIERLYQILLQNRHLSAKEIRQAVINNVRQYVGLQKIFDDITLVVLKQKKTSLFN